MLRSKVVLALAEIASQGKYTVDPTGARRMNQVFDEVAKVINELEAEEELAQLEQAMQEEMLDIENETTRELMK